MIIVVGTKGMLIKTAGILLELDRRNIDYVFVNLGQHGRRMFDLAKLFHLKDFDISFSKYYDLDVDDIQSVIRWFMKSLWKTKKIPKKEKIVVVQGDTPATFLAFLFAKIWCLKSVHVEAGMRSNDLLNPFPEEWIRRIVDKGSDLLFAPTYDAHLNLKKEKISGRIFNTNFNTVIDATRIALRSKPRFTPSSSGYVLVSIHRFENIYSFKRMKMLIDTLKGIKQKIIWPMHCSTKRSLMRHKLMQKLGEIELIPLQDYFSFIHLIKNADFLITDGGGPQEEAYYLGTPCLLMRVCTERSEGLGLNMLVSQFKREKIRYFLNNYEKYKTSGFLSSGFPSRAIVNVLEEFI